MKAKAIDKLNKELENKEIKQMEKYEYIKIIIGEVIKNIDKEPEFATKILHNEKSIKQMLEYFNEQARKQKGKNNVVAIDSITLINWAIHYYDETNEALKLYDEPKETKSTVSKKENVEKIEPKKAVKKIEQPHSLFNMLK